MVVPILFAVGTNVLSFIPLLFVPGETGKFFNAIPRVVICVFLISLFECLLVLPAHLAFAGLINRSRPGNANYTQKDEIYAEIIGKTALKRSGSPQDIAQTALYFMTSAPFVTGQILAVDGGRAIGW